ncbi:MAG: septal ring lytic transglycosylase RlpA family protein [Desulfurivibrionaceae bacterium]|nr:septal ring lytic transglycosylase RlpA family protein [Desulfobulbales bacterium]MDT8335460.1 septal ring lytic transglycosylase RlpA family protein [Desulfurivibrionaceae bacterium]
MKHLFLFGGGLLIILTALSGCGELKAPRVSSTEPYPPITATKKQMAPPTQKPYRIKGKTYYPIPSSEGFRETGLASWYGGYFHGRKTSNGETYNMHGTTAAHKTLPMNTFLLVENLENGREMTVRVNDRGPFHKGRIIDISRTGAEKLGFIDKGTTRVRITALGEAAAYGEAGKTVKKFKDHPDFRRGEFYVQIGSFVDEKNARRLRDKMSTRGRIVVIQKFDRGDQLFFRVQVKAGTTLDEAELVEKTLNRSGFPEAYVVAH